MNRREFLAGSVASLSASLLARGGYPAMTPNERYVETAFRLGVPAESLRNLARAGIMLQPKQLAFLAACRECDRDGGPTAVGYGGARMGGKSFATLAIVGADDCIRRPGLRVLFLRKHGGSAKEAFEQLIPRTIGRLGTYVPSDGKFYVHNGSTIRLGHFQNESDIDKYLGLEYDVIVPEEATTLSQRKWTSIRSCCRSPVDTGWRARIYPTTNPGGVGHAWFKATFVEPARRGEQTDTRFVPATVDDNGFAPQEYRDFLDSLTGWLKRAWRYGDWDIAAGQFYTTFRRDAHVVPAKEFPEPAAHWRTWVSLDHGFVHWTIAYLLSKDSDGMTRIHSEHAARRALVERNAAGVIGMCARQHVPMSRVRKVVAGGDVFSRERDGKTVANDYAKAGLKLTRANMDRCDGAAELLRLLGDVDADPPIPPRIQISDACPRLIECIPSLEHDPECPEDVLKVDTDVDTGIGGDDPYDAARYGVMEGWKPRVPAPAVARSEQPRGRSLPKLHEPPAGWRSA